MRLFVMVYMFSFVCAQAQTTVPFTLTIDLVHGNDSLKLDHYYPYKKKDSLTISAFRFYISHIEFLHKGQLIFAEPDSYHLIDAEIKTSQTCVMDIPADVPFDHV